MEFSFSGVMEFSAVVVGVHDMLVSVLCQLKIRSDITGILWHRLLLIIGKGQRCVRQSRKSMSRVFAISQSI